MLATSENKLEPIEIHLPVASRDCAELENFIKAISSSTDGKFFVATKGIGVIMTASPKNKSRFTFWVANTPNSSLLGKEVSLKAVFMPAHYISTFVYHLNFFSTACKCKMEFKIEDATFISGNIPLSNAKILTVRFTPDTPEDAEKMKKHYNIENNSSDE